MNDTLIKLIRTQLEQVKDMKPFETRTLRVFMQGENAYELREAVIVTRFPGVFVFDAGRGQTTIDEEWVFKSVGYNLSVIKESRDENKSEVKI